MIWWLIHSAAFASIAGFYEDPGTVPYEAYFTRVTFLVSHPLKVVEGGFNDVKGGLSMNPEKPGAGARFTMELATTAIDHPDEKTREKMIEWAGPEPFRYEASIVDWLTSAGRRLSFRLHGDVLRGAGWRKPLNADFDCEREEKFFRCNFRSAPTWADLRLKQLVLLSVPPADEISVRGEVTFKPTR